MYAKALRETMGRLSADMHAIIDKATKENNRGLTSEERERFHALEADYTATEDSVKLAEKDTSIVAHLAETPGTVKISESQMEELRAMYTDRKSTRLNSSHIP